MDRSDGFRIRSPRLLTDEWGVFFAVAAVFAVLAHLEDTYRHGWGASDWVFMVLPAVLAVAALWPVRVLEVGARGLRYRERVLVDGERPMSQRGPRGRKAAWPYVAEILLTSRYGSVVLVVGLRDAAGGPRSAVVELPVRDEQAVAEAFAVWAPGVPVLRVRLTEALARTRRPYTPGPRMARTWLLIAGVAVLGAGFDFVRAIVWDTPYLAVTGLVLLLCVWIRRWSPTPEVGPGRVVLGRWPRRRAVAWADVASVRLSSGPGTLTLSDDAGRVFSQRVPRRDDLADLAAILSAYAPPAVLGAPSV
ncbi:hypothetical protein [Actinomadura sp. DC4]|uniref:hypothetical protein n=1 Tax=Actinomadura sp. DC4 TaxID=3055069 RepID=UPI0025B1C739|nr:hypothetical protein [Actinomadura sp. DC4]MDN3358569.1 hypothetical protein [Actinomadura sp. DC4]